MTPKQSDPQQRCVFEVLIGYIAESSFVGIWIWPLGILRLGGLQGHRLHSRIFEFFFLVYGFGRWVSSYRSEETSRTPYRYAVGGKIPGNGLFLLPGQLILRKDFPVTVFFCCKGIPNVDPFLDSFLPGVYYSEPEPPAKILHKNRAACLPA